ncbi:MAG: hypothetical protein NC819_02115 [Candidatus Omnitrophica bacterium]|nr:hypothetical protein [Candidatus Omnitrophota bacterium]
MDRLRQYSVDWDGLVSWIATQLGCPNAPTTLLGNRLWDFRNCHLGNSRITTTLVRGIHWPDAEQILGSLLDDFNGALLSLYPSSCPPGWVSRKKIAFASVLEGVGFNSRGRLVFNPKSLLLAERGLAKTPRTIPALGDLLSNVALQLHPGKHNPSFAVARQGGRLVNRSLQQAEYAVLLHLAQTMRKSRRRRNQPEKEWGWVEHGGLVALIARRSQSSGNAAQYVATIVSRLRDKLASAIQETGATADRLRVIENAAPVQGKKRSLYRLTIHPDRLILPRS